MPYRPHQQRVLAYAKRLVNLPGLYLYHSLGSGKTLLLIGLIEQLRRIVPGMKQFRALIVTKRSLVEAVRNELLKSKETLEPQLDLSLYEVTTCNLLYNDEKRHMESKWSENFIMAVDESHTWRNASSKLYPTLFRLASRAARTILMSATPVINYPHEFSAQLNLILAHPSRPTAMTTEWGVADWAPYLPTTRLAWKRVFGEDGLQNTLLLKRYMGVLVSFHEEDVTSLEYKQHYGTLTIKDLHVPMKPDHESMYVDLMNNKTDAINQVYDVSKPTTSLHHSAPPNFRNTWMSFQPDEIRQFQGQLRLSAATAVKKDTRFLAYVMALRMACNRMYKKDSSDDEKKESDDDDDTDDFYAPKFQKVLSRIYLQHRHDPKYKAIIYTNFIASGVDVCVHYLKRAKIPFEVISGAQSCTPEEVFQRVSRYNRGNVRVLIFTTSGCHGLDLKKTSEAFIMDPHWNYEKIRQAIGRVHRFDSHEPGDGVVVYQCFTEHSKRKTADIYLRDFSQDKSKIITGFSEWIKNHCIERQTSDYTHKWMKSMSKTLPVSKKRIATESLPQDQKRAKILSKRGAESLPLDKKRVKI